MSIKTVKLGRTRWIGQKNLMYQAALKNRERNFFYIEDKSGALIEYECETFSHNGEIWAVIGFDHYNGHFSGFTDQFAVKRIQIKPIVF